MHSRMYLCISMCVFMCAASSWAARLEHSEPSGPANTSSKNLSFVSILQFHTRCPPQPWISDSTQNIHTLQPINRLLSVTHTHTHLNPFAMNHSLFFLWTRIYMPLMATEDTEKQLMVLMRNCFPHKCTMLFQLHETLVWKQLFFFLQQVSDPENKVNSY